MSHDSTSNEIADSHCSYFLSPPMLTIFKVEFYDGFVRDVRSESNAEEPQDRDS